MTIKIKTSLITLEINDEPFDCSNLFPRHSVPEISSAIKIVVDEAIKLHNEVKK